MAELLVVRSRKVSAERQKGQVQGGNPNWGEGRTQEKPWSPDACACFIGSFISPGERRGLFAGIGRNNTEFMTNVNKILPALSACIVMGEHTIFKMQPLEPYYNIPLCRRHVFSWGVWPGFTSSSRNYGHSLPSPIGPVEGMALAAIL